MGQHITKKYITSPDTMPTANEPPTFDPLMGFPNGRKERVMIATEQEMRANNMPMERRDYCAHFFLELEACRARVLPWVYKCVNEKNKMQKCLNDDWILRMKEYEREHRLLERKKRRALKEQAAAA